MTFSPWRCHHYHPVYFHCLRTGRPFQYLTMPVRWRGPARWCVGLLSHSQLQNSISQPTSRELSSRPSRLQTLTQFHTITTMKRRNLGLFISWPASEYTSCQGPRPRANFICWPCGLYCVQFFFSSLPPFVFSFFPLLSSPDWLRHCGGQRDHGHPGSGQQPGRHEEQAGPHGGGDESLRPARHRRGPGVCFPLRFRCLDTVGVWKLYNLSSCNISLCVFVCVAGGVSLLPQPRDWPQAITRSNLSIWKLIQEIQQMVKSQVRKRFVEQLHVSN